LKTVGRMTPIRVRGTAVGNPHSARKNPIATGDNELGRSKKKEEEALPGLEEDGRETLPESGFQSTNLIGVSARR